MKLNRKYLNSILDYHPQTGKIYWKKSLCSKRNDIGKEAGCYTRGYILVRIKNTLYRAHRIIWLMHYGKIDTQKHIDHINGIGSDNRLENLRLVTRSENLRNAALPSNNKTGVRGVYKYSEKKWCAQIRNIKTIHLGLFDSFEDAVKARKEAELKYNYHPNHGQNRHNYTPTVSQTNTGSCP